MENTNLKERFKTSITLKILTILFMILLLMIPNLMIQDLIKERSNRKVEIENEVGKSYGQQQKMMLPILKIPYQYETLDANNNPSIHHGALSVSPNTSKIVGDLSTELRKRSIYEVVVYEAQLALAETFKFNDLNLSTDKKWENHQFDFSKAYFILGISDANGLSEETSLTAAGVNLKLKGNADINLKHMHFIKTEPFELDIQQDLIVTSNLKFKGTKSINFEPLGEELLVELKSPWKDPSFTGKRLPDNYDISDDGFTSKWKINKFSHTYPTYWVGNSTLNKNFSFGVNLIQPIDEYGKNKRTAKYALLIISLTFGIFFFFEILFKKLIHPVQYTLIGFALTIFYLLLLSITEHTGFDIAYILSSIATVGLIVIYAKAILKNKKATLVLTILLSFLFGYIFVILQLQDFALLAGALALFVILSIVMMLSRNVNWYQLSRK